MLFWIEHSDISQHILQVGNIMEYIGIYGGHWKLCYCVMCSWTVATFRILSKNFGSTDIKQNSPDWPFVWGIFDYDAAKMTKLFVVMAFCLLVICPVITRLTGFCSQLHTRKHTSVKFESKYYIFHPIICICKYRLQNVPHPVLGRLPGRCKCNFDKYFSNISL